MRDEVILVTGGAGFIGSALVRHLIFETEASVLNVDALTYAANLSNVAAVANHQRYRFEQVDICSAPELARIFARYVPTAVVHLAAETHVDRSIDDPVRFVETNVLGTATLLRVAYDHWRVLTPAQRARFRFLHVSTDEVYGSLEESGAFSEEAPYRPNSPYAASKAGADHLARAWHKTYGLPVLISNCSNNFGPYQFPEKFIPLLVINGLEGRPMPIYGRGENVRDWLFVEDHARALLRILRLGRIGECYNIGAGNELRNIEVAHLICDLLNEQPLGGRKGRRELITFVEDRPGHDARYAIDGGKIRDELGWSPQASFADALRGTVAWYCENERWWHPLRAVAAQRLGLAVSGPTSRPPGKSRMEVCDSTKESSHSGSLSREEETLASSARDHRVETECD
jgi:dTDP-glucose 4,6-dehydratase